MIPLYDESFYSKKFPKATLSIIGVCVLAFLLTYFSGDFEQNLMRYGAIPAMLFEGRGLYTIITSIFVHGGLMHIIGNMWFLWVFGDNVEDNFGVAKFLLFYLAAGVVAVLIHAATVSEAYSVLPVVGASGAISGVLGAYIWLFPKNRIRAFMILLYRPLRFYVPAYFYIGVWFLYQIIYASGDSSVAYSAHIGGFIFGLLVAVFYAKRIKRVDYYEEGGNLVEIQSRSSGWEQD